MAELEEACVSITITMARSKRQAAELKACEGELAASKQKVTALEAQLALQERAATRGTFTDTAVEHPTAAAAASPPGRPINSASSDIGQTKDGDTTDEEIEELEYGTEEGSRVMGGCGASPAVATLWGAKRLVLLAKVSGLRSETTTLFESPRRSLERVPIPSSQLRFRLNATAGGAQQRRRERR